MKKLFFYAAAEDPRFARALEDQTRNTLRPFSNYLWQAIHTAQSRQVRYKLPWEKVRRFKEIIISPVECYLRIPRRLPSLIIRNWPLGKKYNVEVQGFCKNRSVPFDVYECEERPNGLILKTDPPLREDDQIFWVGGEYVIEKEESIPVPEKIITPEEEISFLSPPKKDGEQHWLLHVNGLWKDGEINVDGKPTLAEVIPGFKDLGSLKDQNNGFFPASGFSMKVEEFPADGLLQGSNGLKYKWHSQSKRRKSRGVWVQLLPPEEKNQRESSLDPRASFCESDIREVWTQKRYSKQTTIRVMKVDSDRYQLLLTELPNGSLLYLPVNIHNLRRQNRALHQLQYAPLPHHRGLLRLCENPEKVEWPEVENVAISEEDWLVLKDNTRSGTEQQRRFVRKALGSPDLTLLEGPPGSGKTTAICELVLQFAKRGKRVLLCASTHVAIDNVLERLVGDPLIDAIRIGHLDRVDDAIQQTQLDNRVDKLMLKWKSKGFSEELKEMAERTIIMGANLTCGTMMGIARHPFFQKRDDDYKIWEKPITTLAHWDVLIVDEASKTLIQEFLVPALMAKRWVIVGDIHQLPPFTDRDDIVANLRDLIDHNKEPIFPREHQQACLILFRLLRDQLDQPGLRWLIVESQSTLFWLVEEIETRAQKKELMPSYIHVVDQKENGANQITLKEIKSGSVKALLLAGVEWVFVSKELIDEVAPYLPSHLLLTKKEEELCAEKFLSSKNPFLFRRAWWIERTSSLEAPYRDKKYRREELTEKRECEDCESDWFRRHDLAQELAWRITRMHELRQNIKNRSRKYLKRDLEKLKPHCVDISDALEELRDVGLPSILEVIQNGIGKERSKRKSALTMGMRNRNQNDFDARFESLSFQHRMHPEISSFPREIIYGGEALKDANTIALRNKKMGWNFGPFSSRRAWAQIKGRESGGVNQDEISAIKGMIRSFIRWAEKKGSNNGKNWEIACLSFYVKQENALSIMLKELTGDPRKTRFLVSGAPVEIVCGTVDRFQGREADLVALSMRNTRRIGFLDSPNRLNVAVTRARQQLIVFGNAEYFKTCGTFELEELAKRTKQVDKQRVALWRNRKRRRKS